MGKIQMRSCLGQLLDEEIQNLHQPTSQKVKVIGFFLSFLFVHFEMNPMIQVFSLGQWQKQEFASSPSDVTSTERNYILVYLQLPKS